MLFSFSLPAFSDASYLDSDILDLSSPSLKNITGEKIDALEAGHQAVIRVSMHNNEGNEQAFVMLVEVRDGSGITEQLSWQSGTISANGNYMVDISWMPEHICWWLVDNGDCYDNNYEIRAFVITSLENPQILSEVSATGGIKVTGSLPNPPLDQQQFELTLNDGRKYTIDYSFSKGEGKIAKIEVADNEPKSTIFVLADVSENSRFTITVPMFLYYHLFINNAENKPVEIEAFVDGDKNTSYGLIGDKEARHITFVFSLEKGAEEVKIAGMPYA